MILTKNIDVNRSLNAVIICPDAVSICQSNSTCCLTTNGDYSCCPIENGVCCSDHIHCCPHRYKCDLKIYKCDRGSSTKILEMKPSLTIN